MPEQIADVCVAADAGPTLLYVHDREFGSATFVDQQAPTDPRERALCRALLLHALALLDATEPASTNGTGR
ncbi:hypothetical protein H114_00722 [Streptomyces gancidicus BKS 13-15]|uniref:Uncharacterized protein n=1 Tax=Streptomyces gancidicus BKS 13-15 TaxID=1284664 RepID=M3EBL9_STREZ|nr:hypothetical protein [Streptomyces gancidicus]EMF31107.1 hypothetical protein H114_00722 [Streptomyces gancidicus BKS 13-15]